MTEPAAKPRGAGLSADSHHIAQPDPSGAGAVKAMQNALVDGGLEDARVADDAAGERAVAWTAGGAGRAHGVQDRERLVMGIRMQ